MIYIVSVLAVLLIGMAAAAVFVKSLRSAIIILSALSMFASLVFLVLAAPDVAITEASIGSALTTVIFVIAMFRTRKSAPESKSALWAKEVDEAAYRARRVKEDGGENA